MMIKPPQESSDLLEKITPYAVRDKNGMINGVRDDSPEEIRKAFELWLKKYALPARKAAENGALFY